MGSDRVVVASPALDDDLGLAQTVEDLAVEQLVAKAGVEAFNVAVIRYVGRRCLTCSADLHGLAYGATSRDMGHREHVKCGQAAVGR